MKLIDNKFIYILGHSIEFKLLCGNNMPSIELDVEVYEISKSIIDGFSDGEIFVTSIDMKCSWKIKE